MSIHKINVTIELEAASKEEAMEKVAFYMKWLDGYANYKGFTVNETSPERFTAVWK